MSEPRDQQVTFWPCGCMANKFGNHGEACRHPLPRVQSPLPAECCEGVCDGIPHDDDCETPLWEEIDRLKRERDEAITALHQLYKHDRIADARRILFDAGRLDCDTKAGSDCA